MDFISLLNDGGFDGVVVETRSVRQYDTDYAAHILGRTGAIQSAEELNALNADWQAVRDAGEDTSAYHQYDMEDTVGRDGVEQAFESYLRGKDGTRLITTDEEGKTTGELYSIQPEPGGTVALTIDIDFQAQVEGILAQAVEEMNAEDGLETRGAGAVVLSVEDSSVLALGLLPQLQPADLRRGPGGAVRRSGDAFLQPCHRRHLRPRLHLQAPHRRGGSGGERHQHDLYYQCHRPLDLPRLPPELRQLLDLQQLRRPPRPDQRQPGPHRVLQLLLCRVGLSAGPGYSQ